MAGFNGTGTWSRTYNWTQDAANSIKILASRQDTEWANVTSGFNLAMTRDGQAVWTGSQNAGGFGITNAASGGTTGTNVATIGDIQLIAGQWQIESTTVSFGSTTTFTVTGVDKTATYTRGRRVRITHNGGATITNGTVVSSAFVTNTTVTVAMDGSVALVSTVTIVQYSNLLPDQIAVPYGTAFQVSAAASGVTILSGGTYAVGSPTQYPLTSTLNDVFSEFNVNIFTAKYAGLYGVYYQVSYTAPGVITVSGRADITVAGGGSVLFQGYPGSNATATNTVTATIMGLAILPVGGTVQGSLLAPVYSSGTFAANGATMFILRLR